MQHSQRTRREKQHHSQEGRGQGVLPSFSEWTVWAFFLGAVVAFASWVGVVAAPPKRERETEAPHHRKSVWVNRSEKKIKTFPKTQNEDCHNAKILKFKIARMQNDFCIFDVLNLLIWRISNENQKKTKHAVPNQKNQNHQK